MNTDTDALVRALRKRNTKRSLESVDLMREAADTIERLTRERDEAVARERERCAQLCEDMRSEPSPYQGELEYRVSEKAYEVAQECARAIRATKD